MSQPPATQGRPPTENTALIESFNQEIVKQGERLDDLAKELFKLEIWIPGLFTTVLTLIDKTEKLSTTLVGAAFFFWATALIIALYSLLPKKYTVLKGVPSSVQDFYHRSARRKYKTLVGSAASFFVGIIFAVLSVTTL